MGSSRCINPKNSKIIELADKLGYSAARTAAEVEVWQKANNKGLAEMPTIHDLGMKFLPWAKNVELYKRFDLITKQGDLKLLTEKEAKAWAESANRSPEFYFQPVKDIHKGYHVSIAKRLQDKRDIFKEIGRAHV